MAADNLAMAASKIIEASKLMAAHTSPLTVLTAATQAAARDYAELLTLCPKDKAALKKAHARYKAAQAAEM